MEISPTRRGQPMKKWFVMRIHVIVLADTQLGMPSLKCRMLSIIPEANYE